MCAPRVISPNSEENRGESGKKAPSGERPQSASKCAQAEPKIPRKYFCALRAYLSLIQLNSNYPSFDRAFSSIPSLVEHLLTAPRPLLRLRPLLDAPSPTCLASGPGPGWLLLDISDIRIPAFSRPFTAAETALCITLDQPASCVLCLRASKIPKLSAQGETHENPMISEANQDTQNLELLYLRYVIQLLEERSLCPSLKP